MFSSCIEEERREPMPADFCWKRYRRLRYPAPAAFIRNTTMRLTSGLVLTGFLALSPIVALAGAPPTPGSAAPDFTLKASDGKTVSLDNFKGKYVVLEWVNFGCPFVQKHYHSGNMQELQKTYTGKNVAWLSICSSAPGKQGYYDGNELTEKIATMKSAATAYLVDADGTVGKLYGAKATPTMVVISPEGTVLYEGGIDDIASTNIDDIKKARNFVRETLDNALAGKDVEVTSSRAYGCSVKYKN
jgi:peroxiredoxin